MVSLEHGAFMAGVLPGSPNTDYEVRILVCWMLHQMKSPVAVEQLQNALLEEELVNYFELADAISRLVTSGHLIKTVQTEGDRPVERLAVSDLGIETAETFGKQVPFTARTKAIAALQNIVQSERFISENLAQTVEAKDGFMLNLAIRDIGNDLLRLCFYAPTRESCERMKKNFLRDPTVLYRSIFATLMGEEGAEAQFAPPAKAESDG